MPLSRLLRYLLAAVVGVCLLLILALLGTELGLIELQTTYREIDINYVRAVLPLELNRLTPLRSAGRYSPDQLFSRSVRANPP